MKLDQIPDITPLIEEIEDLNSAHTIIGRLFTNKNTQDFTKLQTQFTRGNAWLL